MTNVELVKYWQESSDDDYDTMIYLYEGKKYSMCLFMGHLTIEKLLKGLYAMKYPDNPHAPKIHNLLILAEKCDLELSETQSKLLSLFTKFNINARYEDFKKEFYNRCTREYTEIQVRNIQEVREWLKRLLTQQY